MPRDEGAPVWVEIPSTGGNRKELEEFYSALFPSWKFKAAEAVAHYELPGTDLSGGIIEMPEGCKPEAQAMGRGMTVYYLSKDLEATEKKVAELGGKTCLEKQKEGDNGWFMNFYDPQGNRFGCYQPVM